MPLTDAEIEAMVKRAEHVLKHGWSPSEHCSRDTVRLAAELRAARTALREIVDYDMRTYRYPDDRVVSELGPCGQIARACLPEDK